MAAFDEYVTEDGDRDAPPLLLLNNAAAPSAQWIPLVPALAERHRVIRIDLVGHGTPPRYDVPAQVSRIVGVLEQLGVRRVTVVGHSSGCLLATALVEQRPDLVGAVALIDMGPTLASKRPERLLFRLVRTRFPGALLWRLRSPQSMVKSAGGTHREVELPDSWLEHVRRLTHADFRGLMGAYVAYLGERALPERLRDSGVPLLVIFGADDDRWHSSSAQEYLVVPGARVELLPGVGHTPPVEDPEATAKLLLDFSAARLP